MAFTTENRFDFVSRAVPEDTFGVVRFQGSEGLSKPYQFEITLVAANPQIDLDKVLQYPATFTILREEGDIPFHGILARFDQLHEVDNYVFYKARLVPKLWWLSLTHHNQVFLNKTVPQVMEAVLKDGGLTNHDFELRIQNSYPSWEYICQYRESHLNFVNRWLEREGLYYYFEQSDETEKLIITDSQYSHTDMPHGRTMYYSPPSGLDERHREEVIKAFVLRQKMLPRSLHLKDYNYRTPSLEISGNAQVIPDGRGDVRIYGEHFRTPEEGKELAKIRAEELLCHQKRFYGEGTIPYLRPGYRFELEDHYRDGFNQTYLTIELGHEGSQAAYLLAGIQRGFSEVEKESYYRNSFVAIPADVQFRPDRTAEKPRLYGTMNARIDAAGSGKYAELDERGRYKVILPFDLSGRKDGKASTWLRMAQPYAGTDHGMHFPLHKGAEVLLTFIDGDPDRPIVSAAVPNPETPSLIGSGNETMAGFRSGSGNVFHMEDSEGHERIVMKAGDGKSFMKLGSGSGSEMTWGSGWQDATVDYAKSNLEGIVSSTGSMVKHSTLTGHVAYRLLKQLIENLVKKVPDMVAPKVKHEDEPIQKDDESDSDYLKRRKEWQEKEKQRGETEKKIGTWTPIVTTAYNLFTDLATMELVTKILKLRMKSGIEPKDAKSKWNGTYAYTALHHNGATLVEQKGKYHRWINLPNWTKWLLGLGFLPKAFPETSDPESMLMATTKGSLLFYGEKDFDVTAGNKAVIEAKRINATITEGDVAKASFVSKQFRVKTADRFEIQTGELILPAKVEHNTRPKEGINIVAGGSHNIKIKQSDKNNTGTIEVESNKEVTLKVGENTIKIDKDNNIFVDAGKKIELKVGSNTVSVDKKEVTIDGSTSITAKVKDSQVAIGSSEISLKCGPKLSISKSGMAKIDGRMIQLG